MSRVNISLGIALVVLGGVAPCVAQIAASQPASSVAARSLLETGSSQPVVPQTPAATTPATQIAAVAAPVSPHDRKQAQQHYNRGRKFFTKGKLERAEGEYAEAARLDPTNELYVAERELTRTKLVSQLVESAAADRRAGQHAAAQHVLEKAHSLDPANSAVDEQIRAEAEEAEPAVLSSAGFEHVELGAIHLQPTGGPQAIHSRGGGQELIRQLFQKFGISVTLDSSVPNQVVKADTEELDFDHATALAMLLTGSFYVPLDPHRVLIAKDTPENRAKFERVYLETVYMPGLTTTELQDAVNIARQILGVKLITSNAENGSLTIRAPQNELETLNAMLTDLYQGHSQVLLKLSLYQIADTKERVVGVTLPSQFTLVNIPAEVASLYAQYGSEIAQLIASGLVSASNPLEILAALLASGQVSNFPISTSTQVFGGGLTEFGANLGGVTGNAMLNSSRTHQLDEIQLRVGNQETATFRNGSRYPIITASYSSGVASNALGTLGANIMQLLQQNGVSTAALSSASTPTIPNIQYEDLGLTVKATPTIQKGGDVTMKLEVKISALAGGSLNNVPILANREFATTIGIKEGEASMITSDLSKQESKALTGIPGLNDIPGFPATNVDRTVDTTQLVMVLEPHVVRFDHPLGHGRMILLPLH
jgi:type II secretory pathway component GspD/PulD (secretin)